MKEKLVKILWTMLILILMLAIVPTVQAANENKIGEKNWYGIIGDVNGDKQINSKDSQLIMQYSVGEKRLTLFQKKRADVNQDGEINSNDSLKILEYATQATTKPSNNKVNVSSVTITGKDKMYVGETTNLSVKIEPSNATNTEVKWSSGSSAKAAVDANGNVTAKKAGKVKIIAKVDGQRKTHEIEIVERKDKKLEDLGKVKITTITTTKPAELHVNSRNDAWIVNNCVNETEVTKTYKINASKDYVSSGAISLFLANKILGKTGDTIINYQVKENGKYVAWRTDWAKGNYEKIEFENFEQEMNKICEELMDGNPVAIAVNDENGNFRYVLAYAMTIPTQANPQFDAKDIYVIDPTIGGYKNLSDYYEFIEKATGEITYRIQCLNTKAVKMTLDSSSKTLDKGKTATLTPKFTNANVPKLKKVKSWTSSNTKVATVDSNGKVTAKGVGTATITAISAYPDDGSVKATCKITVKETKTKGQQAAEYAVTFVGKSGNELKNQMGFNYNWCAHFATYCLKKYGLMNNIISGVGDLQTYAKNNKTYKTKNSYTPKPGDVIFLNFNEGSYPYHVGLVTSVEGNIVHTVEGNTGSANNWENRVVRVRDIKKDSNWITGYMSVKE